MLRLNNKLQLLKMKRLLFCFAIIISSISFGQSAIVEVQAKDSLKEIVLEKLALLNSIDVKQLSSIKICSSKLFCKGFIFNTDTLNNKTSEMKKVAIIKKIAPYAFEIKYKYRDSKDFLIDTFNIYCRNDFESIAFPIDCKECEYVNYLFEENKNQFSKINFMPSSDDERDVVFILKENDEIVFYLD